jgi:hypothetical protein
MHTYLVCVVESNPGSLEGRVILLDRNCASVWNADYIYFFCTPLTMTLCLILIVLLRVWATLFSLAGIEVPIVFSLGGHLSAYCFLFFSFLLFLYVSCSLA